MDGRDWERVGLVASLIGNAVTGGIIASRDSELADVLQQLAIAKAENDLLTKQLNVSKFLAWDNGNIAYDNEREAERLASSFEAEKAKSQKLTIDLANEKARGQKVLAEDAGLRDENQRLRLQAAKQNEDF